MENEIKLTRESLPDALENLTTQLTKTQNITNAISEILFDCCDNMAVLEEYQKFLENQALYIVENSKILREISEYLLFE